MKLGSDYMSILFYWLILFVAIEVISFVLRLSPILGIALIAGLFYIIPKIRNSAYISFMNRSNINNQNMNDYNQGYDDSYSYDNDYSSAFKSTNNKDVFEAEYTEHDAH